MKKIGIGAIVIGIIISVIGIVMKLEKAVAVSIIGGADGPTSVFIAGKVGNGLSVLAMGTGILILVIGLYLIIKEKRK